MERFWNVTWFVITSLTAVMLLVTDPAFAGNDDNDATAIVDARSRADFRVDESRNSGANRNSLRAKFVLSDAMLTVNPRCPSETRVETYPWASYPASSYNLDCENWRPTGSGFQYKAKKNDPFNGGMYNVRVRNTRKGLEVSVRASGIHYFSGVTYNTTAVQINLVVGDQNLCARFEIGEKPNRTERNGMTSVRFRGSQTCVEQPDIQVRRFLQYNHTIVGGATNVSVHKFVVQGDLEQDTFLVYASAIFNQGAAEHLSNLTLSSEGVNYATTSVVNNFYTSVWADPGVPVQPGAGNVRLFDLLVDTEPTWNGPYAIQTYIPYGGIGARNNDYWWDYGPEEEFVGPQIDIVGHGLLHSRFVKSGDAYELGFTSEFERFQLLAVAVRGYGLCHGTQVVLYRDGIFLSIPFDEIDDRDLYVGSVYTEPGELTHAVTLIPEPECRLEFSRAQGIGQTSATLRYAVECTGSDTDCYAGAESQRTTKVCDQTIGCWTCPVWDSSTGLGPINPEHCVRAPDPL